MAHGVEKLNIICLSAGCFNASNQNTFIQPTISSELAKPTTATGV